jgi:hypothetical protein
MIEKYDKKFLQPILLKGYHHLHLMINVLNHKADEDYSLDIFEMIANTSELVKELVNIELLSSHYWFSCSTYINNHWITNKNKKDFFFS